MKKIFAVICAAGIAAGGLWAQEEKPEPGFHITMSMIKDAVFSRTPTGEYAKMDADYGKDETAIYPFQGDGWMEVFQTSMFDDGYNGNVKFEYAGSVLGGFIVLKHEADTGYDSTWDYQMWAKLFGGHLRVVSGNQARYSGVPNYQNFQDFVKTKVDALGVLYPTWEQVPLTSSSANNVVPAFNFPYGYDTPGAAKGYATFASTATDDLFMPAGAFSRQQYGLLLDGNFDPLFPLTVSASVAGLFDRYSLPFKNPWYENVGSVLAMHDSETSPVVTSAMNAGLRVETPGIPAAEFLKAALVYKYSNTRLEKTEAPSSEEQSQSLIDEKVGNHAFGVYANADLDRFVKGLGITLGYSGLYTTWTNGVSGFNTPGNAADQEAHQLSTKERAWFPLYSGIDLRAVYTGVRGLSITFNNNISFASMYGTTDYNREYVVSWAYGGAGKGELNEKTKAAPDRTEDYLGLYNALSVRYALTPVLSVSLQMANQCGIFSLSWEEDPVESVTNSYGLYAGAMYTVPVTKSVKCTVNAGAALRVNSYSYQEPGEKDKHEAGYADFAIPIEVKVEF